MLLPTTLVILLGTCVRLWLFRSTNLAHWLADRSELATPLTSWKRMTEGLALVRAGVSPYSGDVFHETPLMLKAIGFIEGILGSDNMWLAFLVTDMLTVFVLGAVASRMKAYFLERQDVEMPRYDANSEKLLFNPRALSLSGFYVIACYALNPLTVASCVAMTTSVFHNHILAVLLLSLLLGNRLLICTFTALAAYENMYPVMLIIPGAIFLAHKETKLYNIGSQMSALSTVSVIQTVICFASAFSLLVFASHSLENHTWDFVRSTFGFTLSVPDLSPNIGIFWYFFTEVFDHFRSFFVFVFQMHAFIYLAPLTIRLRQHPLFLAYILIALSAVFRLFYCFVSSYPSLADTAFYLSLLPMWRHLLVYMRNEFVAGIMFVVGVVLAPLMWYLWIAAGSANANFYFAITLVICAAQVFLLTDVLFAYLRREYDLFHGVKPTTSDGKQAIIVLD